MTIAAMLPNRPLTLEESLTMGSLGGVDLVAGLFASHGLVRGSDEEMVIATILVRGNRAELAGFDQDDESWESLVAFPDIADLSGVFASLDILNAWVFEHYDRDELVRLHVDIEIV